jgi:hypothetical protein
LNLLQEAQGIQGDRSYLSFASRLILGPQLDGDEGVIRALDDYWRTLVPRIEIAAYQAARRTYGRALGSEQRGSYAAASEDFEIAGQYIAIALGAEALWNQFLSFNAIPTVTLLDYSPPADRGGEFLRYLALDRAIAQFKQFEPLTGAYSSLSSRDKA